MVFTASVEDGAGGNDDPEVLEPDFGAAARKVPDDARTVGDAQGRPDGAIVRGLPAGDEESTRLDDREHERSEQAQDERRNGASSHACAQHPTTGWKKGGPRWRGSTARNDVRSRDGSAPHRPCLARGAHCARAE